MNRSFTSHDMTSFFREVTTKAGANPLNCLPLTDENGQRQMGLILYDATLEAARAAHLLRKTALALACPAGGGETGMGRPASQNLCQVSVEERAQLFTLFGKESN